MNVKHAWERLWARRRTPEGCPAFQPRISLRALGALEAPERETVDAHLRVCPTCRGSALELERLAGTARRAATSNPTAAPSAALRQRWESVVREIPRPERSLPERRSPAAWIDLRWVWAAVAACWMAVLVFHGSAPRSPRPAAPRVALSWTVLRLALGEGAAVDLKRSKPVQADSRPDAPRSDAAFPGRRHEG